MIVILLVLVVGMLCGAALADRFFHSGATSASRRALERLEYTLDGLQAAYTMRTARLAADRDLAGRDGLAGTESGDLDDRILHLPQRHR
ncbi:MAG TPA: hypothetical protein VMU51_25165 [Mycobacteriales bacterium]|nr:hypothetical protein [Mycobacteriales bacterium]